jgi:hypothetical protein
MLGQNVLNHVAKQHAYKTEHGKGKFRHQNRYSRQYKDEVLYLIIPKTATITGKKVVLLDIRSVFRFSIQSLFEKLFSRYLAS